MNTCDDDADDNREDGDPKGTADGTRQASLPIVFDLLDDFMQTFGRVSDDEIALNIAAIGVFVGSFWLDGDGILPNIGFALGTAFTDDMSLRIFGSLVVFDVFGEFVDIGFFDAHAVAIFLRSIEESLSGDVESLDLWIGNRDPDAPIGGDNRGIDGNIAFVFCFAFGNDWV